jgi:DNA polymerase III epsilon subunit family exonuclease
MPGYAVFDIETTGFRPDPDSIVEIAIVHVEQDGEVTGAWDTLLKPAGTVGPSHIHGVTQAMVQNAPRFADVAGHLYSLFAGRTAVAHNLPAFDGRFIEEHFRLAGIDGTPVRRGVCTLALAKRHLPGPPHTLDACCRQLGIKLEDAHQALADTLATAQLLARWLQAGIAVRGAVVPALTHVPAPRIPLAQALLPRAVALQNR